MFGKTKIIATLGPASNSPAMIIRLARAGVRVFRLNFSHGNAADFGEVVTNIRAAEKELGYSLTIMQDLAGPKIRIGILDVDSYTFARGDEAVLAAERPAGSTLPFLPFDHPHILTMLEPGDRMVVADGSVRFRVVRALDTGAFILQACNAGIITSRKGMALPDKSLPVPALTEKDKKDLRDGIALGVDAVALSFVQTAGDILEAREIIRSCKSAIPVVAKLERQNAVNNLDAILEVTDIVMVARGDLGVECPLPALPAIQKRIIRACNKAAKPVIVATQMLLSMVNSPSPTRAETTDVANAVLDGADCVMLSEETAMGAFPVEAVRFMREIADQAEGLLQEQKKLSAPFEGVVGVTGFLASAACQLACAIRADGLVCHSVTGSSARALAAHRPSQPIYAVSACDATLHMLNFSWGVTPCRLEKVQAGHLESIEIFIEENPLFQPGATLVLTAGQRRSGPERDGDKSPSIGTNLVKVFRK